MTAFTKPDVAAAVAVVRAEFRLAAGSPASAESDGSIIRGLLDLLDAVTVQDERIAELEAQDKRIAELEAENAASRDAVRESAERLRAALRLAKEATNGWACYAKRVSEHNDIARLHRAIATLDVWPADASLPPKEQQQ